MFRPVYQIVFHGGNTIAKDQLSFLFTWNEKLLCLHTGRVTYGRVELCVSGVVWCGISGSHVSSVLAARHTYTEMFMACRWSLLVACGLVGYKTGVKGSFEHSLSV
jgi:hypothetical protein